MPPYLSTKKDLTVITPSIDVAYWLIINTPFNVYMLNGFINRKSHSTIGEPYEAFMSEWNIAKAFCGAAGFTLVEGLTDNHIGFVEQKKVIAKKARAVIGLIDSSKLGKVSLGTFARIEEIDIIITDSGIQKEMKLMMEVAGILVILV